MECSYVRKVARICLDALVRIVRLVEDNDVLEADHIRNMVVGRQDCGVAEEIKNDFNEIAFKLIEEKRAELKEIFDEVNFYDVI